MMWMMLQSIISVIKLIPSKHLETRITKIRRAVYLTEIRLLPSMNRQ